VGWARWGGGPGGGRKRRGDGWGMKRMSPVRGEVVPGRRRRWLPHGEDDGSASAGFGLARGRGGGCEREGRNKSGGGGGGGAGRMVERGRELGGGVWWGGMKRKGGGGQEGIT
jgi:hypothetical protein